MTGDGGRDPDFEAELEEVFELVANDTRVEILRTLWDARAAGEAYVSFSELRRRTGVRDGGRFNYHLGKLVPEFVRKREETYGLTHAGEQLIGDAVAGTYTAARETHFSSTVVGDCFEPGCDGNSVVSYRDGDAVFECDTCDRTPDTVPAPPIIVDADGERSVPRAASQFSLLTAERVNRGFCHLCDGPMEATLARSHPDYESVLDHAVDVIHECRACGEWRRTGARTTLIGHPAVVSLLHDAGVDYRSVPHWKQTWLTDATERVESDDPLRIAVTTPIDGEEYTFTLDGDFEVVEWD